MLVRRKNLIVGWGSLACGQPFRILSSKKMTMKTVLIVEDDLVNARVFSKILKKRGGLSVRHTENVEEVMEIAQAGEADIILMDVSLSRSIYQGRPVDGIKITQMLKSDEKTAKLPIILVTAHAMQGDREHFLQQSGADGYISKPVVDHQAFVEQILALLPQD
jgi:two-component system, cell cycle response regulator DivK